MLTRKDWSVYYKELKSTPSSLKLMLLSVGITLASIFLTFLQSPKSFSLFLILVIASFSVNFLIKLIIPLFSLKRLIALQTFFLAGLLLSLLILSFVPIYGFYFANALIITFSVLTSLVFLFTTQEDKHINFILSLLINMLNLMLYSSIISSNIANLLNIIYRLYILNIIALTIILLYIRYIGILSKKKYKFNAIKHFKGFLLTWLTKNRSFYEKVLNEEKLALKSFEINLIKIKQEGSLNREIVILELPIHPGPFLNVGSSDLPTELLKKDDINIMPFHGFTTHYFDLSSSMEKSELINLISNKAKRIYANEKLKISRTKDISIDDLRISAFRLNNLVIAVVEGEKEGIIDDVDPKIKEEAVKIAKNSGFSDMIIIDAHNSEGETYKAQPYTKKDEQLIKGINILISELKHEELLDAQIGISELRLPNGFSKESTGMGKTIIFSSEKEKIAFVLIDSNNIILNLRKAIQERLKELVDKAYICSTDSHILTANFSGTNSYYPLGFERKNWHELINTINSSVKAAIFNCSYCKFGHSKITTRKLKVLGNLVEIYEKATTDLIKYGKIIPYLLFLLTTVIVFFVYPLL